MKKRLGIIILAISVLMIFSGVLLYFVNFNSSEDRKSSDEEVTSKDNKKDEEVNETKHGTPPPIVKNGGEKIKDKHCLNDICIKDMIIYELDDDAYVVAGTMTNNSSKDAEEIFLNLVFDVNGKKIKLWTYVDKIESKRSFEFQTGGTDKKLLEATDYKITTPTAEEIATYRESFID